MEAQEMVREKQSAGSLVAILSMFVGLAFVAFGPFAGAIFTVVFLMTGWREPCQKYAIACLVTSVAIAGIAVALETKWLVLAALLTLLYRESMFCSGLQK